MTRDWTPVRRGEVYCSPACGGGITTCSHAAFVKATKSAKVRSWTVFILSSAHDGRTARSALRNALRAEKQKVEEARRSLEVVLATVGPT